MSYVPHKTIKKIAVMMDHNGYTKELRFVSWNDAEPKLDVREWTPNDIPLRGVTLSDEGGQKLLDGLKQYFKEKEESNIEFNTNNEFYDSTLPF